MWSETLDLLQSVNCPVKALRDSSGGEIDLMTSDQVLDAFLHKQGDVMSSWSASLAERYIRGADILNPIDLTKLDQRTLGLLRLVNDEYYTRGDGWMSAGTTDDLISDGDEDPMTDEDEGELQEPQMDGVLDGKVAPAADRNEAEVA